MKRTLLILSAVTALAPGCASMQALARGGNASDVLRAGADDVQAAARIAEKREKCVKLEQQAVTLEEEYSIGGAVALALAGKSNGVFVEIAPALQSAAPQPNVKPTPGKGEKTDLNLYLNKLGKSLAAFSGRPDIDWTFMVLDSPTPNAFSAPGGYVFVTTGMLKLLDNEAQLAGILGHEIGHVTGRHALSSYKTGKRTSCEVAIVASLAANAAKNALDLGSELDALLNVASIDLEKASAELIEKFTDATISQLIDKGNGPTYEFEADRIGYELMIFAGYDPREYEKVLAKLPDGGGFLTPHPSNQDRLGKLTALRNDAYADFGLDALKTVDNSADVKVVKK